MNEARIVINREASAVGFFKTFKIEVDGILVGELRNGATVEIPISFGRHILNFVSFGKCEKTITVDITEERSNISFDLKINKFNGTLQLKTNDARGIAMQYDNRTSTPNALVKIGSGLVVLIVVLVVVSLIFKLAFNTSVNEMTQENQFSQEDMEYYSQQKNENVIYEDDYLRVAYMRTYNVAGVNTTYLQLKIVNKSYHEMWLSLSDVYVNDISILTGTAVPIVLAPGKISQSPFILFTANSGLTAADISKIEFRIKGRDSNFEEIHTTNYITIGS